GTGNDLVYISTDAVWDVNDHLLGQVTHTGGLAAGDSVPAELEATLPGVVPGDYFVIVRTDIRNQIVESDETNNIGASLDNVTLDFDELTPGVPRSGEIAQGAYRYYRV